MKKSLMTMLFLLAAASLTWSQEKTIAAATKAEQEIMQMEMAWNDAKGKTDRAALARLTAPDFIVYGPNQGQAVRDNFVNNSRSPNLGGIESGELKVRVYGETAVATGWNIRKWRVLDKNQSPQERFTNVWVKRDGKWQIVSSMWDIRKEGTVDGKLQPISCGKASTLPSTKSDAEAFIQFSNEAGRPIIVDRLFPNGRRQKINTLAPGKTLEFTSSLANVYSVTDDTGKCIAVYQPAREPGVATIK